jgi:hypothetical protein
VEASQMGEAIKKAKLKLKSDELRLPCSYSVVDATTEVEINK